MPYGCHNGNRAVCCGGMVCQACNFVGLLGRLCHLFVTSISNCKIFNSSCKIIHHKVIEQKQKLPVRKFSDTRLLMSVMHLSLLLRERKDEIPKLLVTVLVSLVMWCDVPFQINVISKSIQSQIFEVCQSVELSIVCHEFGRAR